MWKVTYNDIMIRGLSPGGDRFTELVDACIRAQGISCGISDSEIVTNQRTNIRDGGVDTEVRVSLVDDPTGWMSKYKTIWQYKATKKGKIDDGVLKKEVNSSYAKKCILENYAYRLCICDTTTAKDKKTFESMLDTHIHNINPDAPDARVLSAEDIALWLSHFPASILYYFRSGLPVQHMESWGTSITELTPIFVDVPTWQPVVDNIKKHVNFNNDIADIIFSISGEAEVGKTRMVYECLKSIPQTERLTVYTSDDQIAIKLAVLIANDQKLNAIVVVDECDLDLRERLRNLLRGCKKRTRIITIDNLGERINSPHPQLWLTKMSSDIVEKILTENFSHIPEQRRHIYANLAGGFVRMAADLCNNHRFIVAAGGDISPVLSNLRDYLVRRLNLDERKIFQALSLFIKIGMKGEVESQMKELCVFLEIKEDQFREIAHRLHTTCGFIGIGGKYFYVTPEIIAQIGFDFAWQRWATQPKEFLKGMPPSLLETFLKRVSKSANEEVRRDVGDFFLKWAKALTGKELADIKSAKQITTLVEVEPNIYLPILQKVIEASSREDLLKITEYSPDARWGPRRLIVWLLERIGAFPDYYNITEKILLKLALAENEPNIANNASGVWTQLFRINLSGTAVPYTERLEILKERVLSDNNLISNLALNALNNIFQSISGGRIVTGPSTIAGAIPPDQWRPKNRQEYHQCINNTLALLQAIIEKEDFKLRKQAINIATGHIRILLDFRFLVNLKSIFDKLTLDDELQIKLIERISNFLKYSKNGERGYESTYIKDVRKWLDKLIPTDFHGKLIMLVGIGSWRHLTSEDEKMWKDELSRIAKYCVDKPKAFEKEIEWLCSSIARDAMALGYEIGKVDEKAVLLKIMFTSAIKHQCSTLTRGYIQSLVDIHSAHVERINNELDAIQEKNPPLAYDLFMAGGKKTKAALRTLELVDQNKLPIKYLQGFTSGLQLGSITDTEFVQILKKLISVSKAGDTIANKIAIELISYGLIDHRSGQTRAILKNEKLQQLVWNFIEATAQDGGSDPYWWIKILEVFVSIDTERAVKIATQGLISSNFHQENYCEKFLTEISCKHPKTVMKELGEIIMDENVGWHFFFNSYRGLISVLPESIIINWIRNNGVEAARHLARHLPKLYIDSEGKPIVPSLTEFVLKEYEGDTRTFHEFCAGIHALETYSGDIAARHEQEAEVAKRFFSHPLKRISEWARIEYTNARENAKLEREFRQELDLE